MECEACGRGSTTKCMTCGDWVCDWHVRETLEVGLRICSECAVTIATREVV